MRQVKFGSTRSNQVKDFKPNYLRFVKSRAVIFALSNLCFILIFRKGDRFWHENKGVFSDAQLQQVKSTTLAKVMCETMEGMTRVTPNPFVRRGVRFEGASNDPVSCGSIGSIDFSSWKER